MATAPKTSIASQAVKRRQNLFDLTDAATRSISNQLDAVRRKAIEEARKSMKDPEATKDDIVRSKRKALAITADIKDSLDRGIAKAQAKLEEASKTALRFGLLDALATVETATGEKATLGGSFSQIFKEAVQQSARSEVLGVKRSEAFDRTRAYVERRLRETLTNAFVNGESVDKTAKQIDEVTGIGQRAAMRVTRTNLIATSNQAHLQVYKENEDVLAGYRWHARFDDRTSVICAGLHGKFWPIGEDPPGPPAHYNCRSVLLPVFKDEEVQEELDQGEVRAKGSDGTELVPATTTFDSWLKDQSDEYKVDVCGSEVKAELFSDGKLTLEDMVHTDLSPLKDEEAVQLALAMHPKDSSLQKMAEEMGVVEGSLASIEKKEKRLASEQDFDQPQEEEVR